MFVPAKPFGQMLCVLIDQTAGATETNEDGMLCFYPPRPSVYL